jgi:uncharacterized membrane protein YdjX (TVP38/TMEM64 family)
MVPGSVLSISVGFLLGVVSGSVAVWIGSALGAWVEFWIGRTVARNWIEKKIAGRPMFEAVDRAVATEGFKIVLMTRLSPLFPFHLLNYFFGVSRVRFFTYAVASAIGVIPWTIMYVFVGATARSLAEAAAGTAKMPAAERILFLAGIVIAGAVAVVVSRAARRALRETTGIGDAKP